MLNVRVDLPHSILENTLISHCVVVDPHIYDVLLNPSITKADH